MDVDMKQFLAGVYLDASGNIRPRTALLFKLVSKSGRYDRGN